MIHTRRANSICLESAPINNALFKTLVTTTPIHIIFVFFLSLSVALHFLLLHSCCACVCVEHKIWNMSKFRIYCRLMSFPSFAWVFKTRTSSLGCILYDVYIWYYNTIHNTHLFFLISFIFCQYNKIVLQFSFSRSCCLFDCAMCIMLNSVWWQKHDFKGTNLTFIIDYYSTIYMHG